MQYPLYEYYSHGSMDLYQVRKHYLEHFYCKRHSRSEADHVLKSIVSSTKVGRFLRETSHKGIAPNCEDFASVVCSMWKFVFKSDETLVLAIMEAALVWDIEVNQGQHLLSPEELKQDIVHVFDKFSLYGEMTEREYATMGTFAVEAETLKEPKKKLPLQHDNHQTVWTFLSFSKEFGEDMFVGKFHRKDDGEPFYSCVFVNDKGHKTFVGFSSKLGVLTDEEISLMKDKLVVIKSPSGNYNLYEDNGTAWKRIKI